MANARGEFVKVYILGLKYCLGGELGINSATLASNLKLLESDVINAWHYWNEVGAINLIPVDNNGNYNIEFVDLENQNTKASMSNSINLLNELNNNSSKGMLEEIQKLLARPLSPKEMEIYLSWQKDFNFTPEMILLLINYCVNKGKVDYRYIEKIAISWMETGIKTIDDVQSFIKQREDKWLGIRKILTYLGIKDADIMKPQEALLEKWLTSYEMPLDVIYRACDICFERINKADFKYIDGILTSWNNDNLKTLADIDAKDKKSFSKNSKRATNTRSQGSFGDYSQRTYDFDELEKKLLGWDK